jgi:predicted amidohydrolase
MNAMNYRESDSVLPGDSIAVFDRDFGRVGLMVCYDLRFPELARTMTSQGRKSYLFLPLSLPAFPSRLVPITGTS